MFISEVHLHKTIRELQEQNNTLQQELTDYKDSGQTLDQAEAHSSSQSSAPSASISGPPSVVLSKEGWRLRAGKARELHKLACTDGKGERTHIQPLPDGAKRTRVPSRALQEAHQQGVQCECAM